MPPNPKTSVLGRRNFLKVAVGATGGGLLLSGSALAYAATAGTGGTGTRAAPVVTKIADLTGPDISTPFGVNGTDLGIPAVAPDGRKLYIFGDSYEGPAPDPGDPNWRSPIGLYSTTEDLAGGVKWDSAVGGDTARQLWDYAHDNGEYTTVLPSDVLTVGDTMYLHVMFHKDLGNVIRTEIWASKDNGETWAHTGATFDAGLEDSLAQLWTWELNKEDNHVYIFSTQANRKRGMLLRRVPVDKITDPAAYVTWGWDGSKWDWGLPAAEVLPEATGEMSLRFLDGKWLLVMFNAQNYRIDTFVLDSPTDDLTQAPRETLLWGTEWGQEDDSHVAQLYGGYVIPGSTLNDLHLAVSQWKTDDNSVYHVMQHRFEGLGG